MFDLYGVFPKIGVPQNGWFIVENIIKMDDLGVPLFSETSICVCTSLNAREADPDDPALWATRRCSLQ